MTSAYLYPVFELEVNAAKYHLSPAQWRNLFKRQTFAYREVGSKRVLIKYECVPAWEALSVTGKVYRIACIIGTDK